MTSEWLFDGRDVICFVYGPICILRLLKQIVQTLFNQTINTHVLQTLQITDHITNMTLIYYVIVSVKQTCNLHEPKEERLKHGNVLDIWRNQRYE